MKRRFIVLAFALSLAGPAAFAADPFPGFEQAIIEHMQVEWVPCPEIEIEQARSIAYTVWCGRSGAGLKEFKKSLKTLLDNDPVLEPRGDMKWDGPVDGLSRLRFWAGDRGVILTFKPKDGSVRIMLRDPIPWCRDLTPENSSPIRKNALHGVSGLTYPQKTHPSRPGWPYGISRSINQVLHVSVSMIIDEGGIPADLCVVNADPDLRASREAAVDTARRWRYTPAIYKNEKVPVAVTVKVKFDPQVRISSGPLK